MQQTQVLKGNAESEAVFSPLLLEASSGNQSSVVLDLMTDIMDRKSAKTKTYTAGLQLAAQTTFFGGEYNTL